MSTDALDVPLLALMPLADLRAEPTPAYDDVTRLYTRPLMFRGEPDPVPPRPLRPGDVWVNSPEGMVTWDGKGWAKPTEPDGKIDCPGCNRRIKPRTDGSPVRHKRPLGGWCPGC